jgi:membrane-associated phospholipid phosphatase
MRGVHAVGWRRIRFASAIVYFLYLADLIVRNGVPTGRKPLTYYVMIGLAITCLGRGWRRLTMVVVDWLPFLLVLLFYDQSRAIADTMGMPLHEADIAHAERWLFGGEVPTVWLQHHLYTPMHVHWYDALATLTYTSHFVVTPVLAAVLWVRTRRVWMRYISRVILLSFTGLATYILFPEAPPWLAAKDGYLQPVARLSARGWQYLHAGFADRLLAAGQNGGANPVAAMPSLHLAFSFLAALTVYELVRWRWRWLIWLYPTTMAWTLMYTGEHYLIDLVFGALYALGCHWVLSWAESWWHARRAQRRGVPVGAPAERAAEVIGAP